MAVDQLGVQSLSDVLAAGTIHSVFQPVIELDSGAVVAYEALARGPEGPLAGPDALFSRQGRTACWPSSMRPVGWRPSQVRRNRRSSPLRLFVNVEPEVLETGADRLFPDIAAAAPDGLQVVLEITERSLFARPAELLRTVERVRDLGWGVALDDVGAETASLALMPLLRPDIVKLDLSLVQQRPTPAIAEIMSAVNAYAERTGALLLAEGIETVEHLEAARALGATLGQGWMFGRPTRQLRGEDRPVAALRLPLARPAGGLVPESPFECLPQGAVLRTAPKSLLVELSKHLEREAMRVGPASVVASAFQEARHVTPATRRRYAQLVERSGLVCALGEGLTTEPMPGVRGASLSPDDVLLGEWDVVVLSPHFAAALLARDLGEVGPDAERAFEYAVTFDRDAVVRAGHALLSRVCAASAR